MIEPAAIILATKKVGTVSGDARRVLDVCRYACDLSSIGRRMKDVLADEDFSFFYCRLLRRSIEKVNQLNSESPSNQQRKCSIQDVISTYKEMSDFGSTAFIKQLPLHSKIMLLALVQCIKKAGVPEVEFNTVCLSVLSSTILPAKSVEADNPIYPRRRRIRYFDGISISVGKSLSTISLPMISFSPLSLRCILCASLLLNRSDWIIINACEVWCPTAIYLRR